MPVATSSITARPMHNVLTADMWFLRVSLLPPASGSTGANERLESKRSEGTACEKGVRHPIDDPNHSADPFETGPNFRNPSGVIVFQGVEPLIELRQERIPLPVFSRLNDVANHLFEIGDGTVELTTGSGRPFGHDETPFDEFGAGHADRPAAHSETGGDLLRLLRLGLCDQPSMDAGRRWRNPPQRAEATPEHHELCAYRIESGHNRRLLHKFIMFNSF
jgi:hypothetical protein